MRRYWQAAFPSNDSFSNWRTLSKRVTMTWQAVASVVAVADKARRSKMWTRLSWSPPRFGRGSPQRQQDLMYWRGRGGRAIMLICLHSGISPVLAGSLLSVWVSSLPSPCGSPLLILMPSMVPGGVLPRCWGDRYTCNVCYLQCVCAFDIPLAAAHCTFSALACGHPAWGDLRLAGDMDNFLAISDIV